MRFNRRPFAIAWTLYRCGSAWHRGCDVALLFCRQLEDIIRKQLAVISVISVKCWWRWPGEDPLVVLLLEQARRHRCAGADGLRIGDPTLDPIGLQAFLRQQKVRGSGDLVVRGIAGSVTLQAGSGGA